MDHFLSNPAELQDFLPLSTSLQLEKAVRRKASNEAGHFKVRALDGK